MFSAIATQYNYKSILNNAAMIFEMLLIRQQGTYILKIIIKCKQSNPLFCTNMNTEKIYKLSFKHE